MLKMEVRPGCTRTKGCSLARDTNKSKKNATLKLEEGQNFTVNVAFGFVTMISVKPKDKKGDFCCFYVTVKMVIFVLVQIQKWYFAKSTNFWVFFGYPNLKGIPVNAYNSDG